MALFHFFRSMQAHLIFVHIHVVGGQYDSNWEAAAAKVRGE